MENEFKVSEVKLKSIKNKRVIKALALPLTIGSLATSCIGIPYTYLSQDQTFKIVDSESKIGIPGLKVSLTQDEDLVTEGKTDSNGSISFSYQFYTGDPEIFLEIEDIDGEVNNLYSDRKAYIDQDLETVTIELDKEN